MKNIKHVLTPLSNSLRLILEYCEMTGRLLHISLGEKYAKRFPAIVTLIIVRIAPMSRIYNPLDRMDNLYHGYNLQSFL